MAVYYNDSDAYAAGWLGNLVAAGHLPAGTVDGRSILYVGPRDLAGYGQCHFFAGIGGWPYAVALAGWPADRPVWTGSCPCQPFSAAGRQGGSADERHLWPGWFRLIRECRPDTIFGEQVEGAVGFGWIDRVFADLEAEGYACGAAVLGAHSVGAPHIRQRLFWVASRAADAEWDRRHGAGPYDREHTAPGRPEWIAALDQRQFGEGRGSESGGLALFSGERREGEPVRLQPGRPRPADSEAAGSGATGGLGDAALKQMGRARQPWQDSVWLACLDGRARRVEPGVFPLAHGVPARVGRLRAYGNAIVPQIAAEFVRAFMGLPWR